MMHCKHYLLIAAGALITSCMVNATTLNVYYLNGNPKQLYSTDTVRSITMLSDGRLVINNYNGTLAADDSTGHIRSIAIGQSAGIGKISNDECRYKVYPNPVSETLSIDNLEKDTHIYLFNISGKMLVDKVAGEAEENLNVSNLASGTYLLKIKNESYKIIKSE